MGFPKPWPTTWPEPADNPKSPEQPGVVPDPDLPAPEPIPDGEELGDVEPLPEFQRAFYAVTWAVNHACNLHCTHCYDAVLDRRRDLSTSDALALIDRLAEAGVQFIAFSGGEAFLRKDLFTLMGYAAQHGMQFSARSNGTRITTAVAQQLKVLGISVVGVSFDGATAGTHDAVRGAGAFEAVLSGLHALRAAGIRAQMEVVLSKANAHEALDFIALGEVVDASEVNFSTMAPQGRALNRSADTLDPATWRTLVDTLRIASARARLPVTPNCALVGACVANLEPHITCDGWMTPCYLSARKLFNVLDTSPAEIRTRLAESRAQFQNVCGRAAWLPARELTREN